jgi:hypothetical protein
MKLKNEPPTRRRSVADDTADLFAATRPANPHTTLNRGRPYSDANRFSQALMWYARQGIRVAAVDVCFHPAGYWFDVEYPQP